jgi:ABC-type lipopolysaccharide export system ATPase subunit
MVMSGIVAFAEETPTTEVPPRVIYTLKVTQDNPKVCGIIEIMGWGEKQPLIFQDSPENPKTGFSRMTPEEIALLQEEPYRFEIVGTIDHMSFDTGLKAALTEFEKFYTYKTKKDGTLIRELQIEKFSESKNPIMSGGHRDNKNLLLFSVSRFEMPLMYEQWAYSLIEDIAPITDIQIPTTGLTCDKLRYMYDHMKKDTFEDNKDREIARDVLKLKKKSKEKIAKDKEAVTEMLLNVKPGKDFEETYGLLGEIFSWFGYRYDDGHVAIVVK